jgi:hypothetical protein
MADEQRIHDVLDLIAKNGCDCECDHDVESHDADCERCLACRIEAVLQGRRSDATTE